MVSRLVRTTGGWIAVVLFVALFVFGLFEAVSTHNRFERLRSGVANECHLRDEAQHSIEAYLQRAVDQERSNRFIDDRLRQQRIASYQQAIDELRRIEAANPCSTTATQVARAHPTGLLDATIADAWWVDLLRVIVLFAGGAMVAFAPVALVRRHSDDRHHNAMVAAFTAAGLFAVLQETEQFRHPMVWWRLPLLLVIAAAGLYVMFAPERANTRS